MTAVARIAVRARDNIMTAITRAVETKENDLNFFSDNENRTM